MTISPVQKMSMSLVPMRAFCWTDMFVGSPIVRASSTDPPAATKCNPRQSKSSRSGPANRLNLDRNPSMSPPVIGGQYFVGLLHILSPQKLIAFALKSIIFGFALEAPREKVCYFRVDSMCHVFGVKFVCWSLVPTGHSLRSLLAGEQQRTSVHSIAVHRDERCGLGQCVHRFDGFICEQLVTIDQGAWKRVSQVLVGCLHPPPPRTRR